MFGLHFSPRYLAIKLLERDREVEDEIKRLPDAKTILSTRDKELQRIETVRKDDVSSAIAE